jgi:hypothetical protein
MFVVGMAGIALAGNGPAPRVPEINPATALGALALLGGSVLVIRARLKK